MKKDLKMDIKIWLDKLYYDIGKQQFDFKVCGLKKIGDEIIPTKWKKYSEVVFPVDFNEGWKLKWINQREIFPNEIILDLEEKKQLKPIIKELKELNCVFYIFLTGSRGFHINIFFNKKISNKERENFLKYFEVDLQIISGHMIALEFVPHWKSGKIKERILEYGI